MKKKIKFGIISGAGPMAGALLYQRMIELLQEKGAWKDSDFPEIFLYNVPFSEMLLGVADNDIVRNELILALEFITHFVDYVYIACQTLHIFLLPEEIIKYKIVNIIELANQVISDNTVYAVASSTSRSFNLHEKIFQRKCYYLEPEKSDLAIKNILQGKFSDLEWLEDLARRRKIILGCTEFSVAVKYLKGQFIDPIELAANDVIRKMEEEINLPRICHQTIFE